LAVHHCERPTHLTKFILIVAVLARSSNGAPATQPQIREVEKVLETYVRGWLAGDSGRILGLFTPDAVLVPDEKSPIVGREAIHSFWWPSGTAPTTVTRFERSRDQIIASTEIAAVRGTQTLEWTTGGSRWKTHGNYLTVLKRTSDGWRITLQMWANAPAERLP
jgi:uncharacterized protein (TIGR02246 family)